MKIDKIFSEAAGVQDKISKRVNWWMKNAKIAIFFQHSDECIMIAATCILYKFHAMFLLASLIGN